MRSWITTEPIDTNEVISLVGDDEDGALLLFLGVVRNHNEGRPVSGIHYDSYAAMAERVLSEITGEAADRLGTDRVAVVHRVGELVVGETVTAIAVSSPHRAESFDAARYIIEEIKVRLPVWKEERYIGGTARWLDGEIPVVASPMMRDGGNEDDAG